MTRQRTARRVSVAALAPHFIHVRGQKVLKDGKLAALLGVTLRELYQRVGPKLWKFPAGCFVQLPADTGRSSLAFTQSGVIAVASVLRNEAMLEIGMDIAHAMQIRRRSSAYKSRPARRAKDPAKAARYIEAVERWAVDPMVVATALHAIMKKILDAVKTYPARGPTHSA